MKPEIKTKWVAALRSGEYHQGTGALMQEGSYCCLGVLCDVASKEGLNVEIVPQAMGHFSDEPSLILQGVEVEPSYDGATFVCDGFYDWEVLPKSVTNWAGLEENNPHVIADGNRTSLADLNDAGTDFNRIADLIEECL